MFYNKTSSFWPWIWILFIRAFVYYFSGLIYFQNSSSYGMFKLQNFDLTACMDFDPTSVFDQTEFPRLIVDSNRGY